MFWVGLGLIMYIRTICFYLIIYQYSSIDFITYIKAQEGLQNVLG